MGAQKAQGSKHLQSELVHGRIQVESSISNQSAINGFVLRLQYDLYRYCRLRIRAARPACATGNCTSRIFHASRDFVITSAG